MNPEAQSLRMAIYFGLPVEVIHQMESWTLIRFSGAKFVVDTTDLVVDPEMAAEQVETPAPIMVGGEGDSGKEWQLAASNQAIRHCRVKLSGFIVVTCSSAAIRVSKGMSAHLLRPCQLSEFSQAIMQTGLASRNQGHSAEAPSACLAPPSPSRARRLASPETSRCLQST
jgi:hypothetical protein